jgi:hypothetical protein
VEIRNSRDEIKILKKDNKSHSLSYCDAIVKLLKITIPNIVSCELQREQVNLMYSIASTLLGHQGKTSLGQLVIDNTRSMPFGGLMTGLSRTTEIGNVTTQHEITNIAELRRDCKVDHNASKYDTFLKKKFGENQKHQSSNNLNKYIIKNNDFCT